jgi:putative PIN family toxin of toxin-antitoxin system
MFRVVLDTTSWFQLLIKAGKPRDLFNKLVKDKQLVLSRAILEEFLDAIEDPKLAKYTSEKDVAVFLNTFEERCKDSACKIQVQGC